MKYNQMEELNDSLTLENNNWLKVLFLFEQDYRRPKS